MPPKRARRGSPSAAALSAGDRLKRAKLTGNDYYSAWGWVGTEVHDPAHITTEHRLATCGLSKRSPWPLCANKYALASQSEAERPKAKVEERAAGGELQEDIIVISDDELPSCSNRECKANPFCLNYLGQEKWEDEGMFGYLTKYDHYLKLNLFRQSPKGLHESSEPRRESHCTHKGT